MTNTRPTLPAHRGLTLTAGAVAAVAALLAMPLAAPPTNPTRVITWWDEAGTAHAAIALVRLAALAAASYVAVVGALVTLSALARLPRLAHSMARGLPAGFQRSLAGATIAASTLSPAFVAAADADPTPAPFVLFDIGSADLEPVQATSVAPSVPAVITESAGATNPADSAAAVTAPPGATQPTDTWTVQRGDHLWGIAEETLIDLTESGEAPSERQVARYWQRLIDENRDTIGADADVIHPGTTLVLPTV